MLSLASNCAQEIRGFLTPDLLKPKYRRLKRPFAGHCYVASEVFYHLMGGKATGLKPMFIRHEGEPHWWILGPDESVWDLTKEQFTTPVPYRKSTPKGFLTRRPSKRAQKVIDLVMTSRRRRCLMDAR